jgi:hypothetical protein
MIPIIYFELLNISRHHGSNYHDFFVILVIKNCRLDLLSGN